MSSAITWCQVSRKIRPSSLKEVSKASSIPGGPSHTQRLGPKWEPDCGSVLLGFRENSPVNVSAWPSVGGSSLPPNTWEFALWSTSHQSLLGRPLSLFFRMPRKVLSYPASFIWTRLVFRKTEDCGLRAGKTREAARLKPGDLGKQWGATGGGEEATAGEHSLTPRRANGQEGVASGA